MMTQSAPIATPSPTAPESTAVAPSPTMTATPGVTAAAMSEVTAATEGADVVEVIIDAFSFMPQVLDIKASTTVVFINREEYEHTATAVGTPRLFDSGTLDTDDRHMVTFDMPGTYEYVCLLHPMMTGTIRMT